MIPGVEVTTSYDTILGDDLICIESSKIGDDCHNCVHMQGT